MKPTEVYQVLCVSLTFFLALVSAMKNKDDKDAQKKHLFYFLITKLVNEIFRCLARQNVFCRTSTEEPSQSLHCFCLHLGTRLTKLLVAPKIPSYQEE